MKQFAFILSLVLCLSTVTFAQSTSRADELMQQAQTNLKQKEYIKARYLFLQAYNAFSSQEKYDKAVECGVNASALGKTIIRKLSSCCAVRNYWLQEANRKVARLCRICASVSIRSACKCTSTLRTLPEPKSN